MGANTFFEIAEGVSARQAFEDLVEQAQHEHGHGGYTGTIAEKSEFTLIPGKYENDQDAERAAIAMIDTNDPRVDDKWGPAGAIALPGEGRWLFFGWASC